MSKCKFSPEVMTTGVALAKSAAIAKKVCKVIKYIYLLRFAYIKIRKWLKKLDIHLPIGKPSWRK